ncbi:MAG: hypothetical protein ACN6I4_01130 [bacterium]
MKKTLVAFGLLLVAYSAAACDVCGCAVGGNSMGILPRFSKHFIGIRATHASFISAHPTLFEGEEQKISKEYFTSTTLWGRYVPHKRIQVFAQIPYNYFVREEDGQRTITEGLGDINLLANYVVFNTTDSNKSTLKHSLQVGGGIKLPTGVFNKSENGDLLNINMQSGSGSYDVPINLLHTIRFKSFGINTELRYTFNNANPDRYELGDRFLASSRAFYWKNYRNITFLPQVGVAFEHYGTDKDGRYEVDYTGGTMLQLDAGVDVYFYKWAMGAHLRNPIQSNMGQGFVTPNAALTFNLMYLL